MKRWGAKGGFRAFSAGITPTREIDPSAAEILKHYHVWDSSLRAKSYTAFLIPDSPQMDFVIWVDDATGGGAFARWPGNPEVIRWRITQPVKNGTAAEIAYSVKTCFRELENRIKLFILVYQREASKRVATAA
jgi:arsenate reductase